MKRKLLLMIFLACTVYAPAQTVSQNPHGSIKWDCQSCHETASWQKMKNPMDFKHEETGFLLIGAHKFTNCVNCHGSLKFAEVGTACADCHTDVHRGQFGAACQNCHTSNDWRNQQEALQMHAIRGFPLVGVHAIADCQSCHVNDQYNEFSGTPLDCNSCHLGDFSLAANPNHTKAGFNLDCQSCHPSAASKWQNATYVHTQSFALHGAHSRAECNSCHVSAYFGTSPECYSCHSGDFQNTNSPPHVLLGFSQNCAICHGDEQWEGGSFDHVQASGFELRGAHAAIACNDCHVNNQFSGLPRECFGCHQSDFNATTAPNHAANQFPTDCLTCHNENGWQPAEFDHNLTSFPLTGAHQTIACESCHENGQFTALPTDCYSCHEGDFTSAADPNHVQNNFSHECNVCHSTSAWQPASFDHNQTQFPLTGAHITLQCLDCHSNGYSGTPTDCYACHQNDYNNTNDPNHQAAGFPTDCRQCHGTSNWNQTTWDHDNQYFPIYSGKHKEEWQICADCHVNPSNYAVFECIFCHEHNQQEMDDKHQGVSGYVYLSSACYDCHPDGNNKVNMPRIWR